MAGKKETEIVIAPPKIERMIVTIKGVTPLLTSNGESAIAKLEEAQKGPRQKGPKVARDPEADFQTSRYLMDDGKDGFPGTGIKRALKDAGIRNKAGTGTEIAATIQFEIGEQLLPIIGPPPYNHKAFVRHGGRVADLAYRACFIDWRIRVPVSYNAGVIAKEHVLSLFTLAGFSIGIGAWRPEKNGTFGRFEIDTVEM